MTACEVVATSLTSKTMELAIESYASSVEYMKLIIPLVAHNIIYHRVDYDENFYDHHKIGDTFYKSIKKNLHENHQLTKFRAIMKNAMVSLDKRYMDELFVVFRTNDTKEVFEHYRFSLKYDRHDSSVLPTGKAVINATAKFFQNLSILKTRQRINGKKMNLAVQILNNQSTPYGYVAPYFRIGEKPYVDSENRVVNFRLGTLSTGFHELKVYGKGCALETGDDESEAESMKSISVNPDEECEERNTITENELADKREKSVDGENVAKKRKIEDNCANGEEEHNCNDDDVLNGEEADENVEFNCLCQISENVSNIPIIACIYCKMHTHLSCIGYRSIQSIGCEYICFDCCKQKNKRFCDNNIKAIKTKIGRTILAIKRLITMFSLNNPKKSPKDILDKITVENKHIGIALKKADLIYVENKNLKANYEKMREMNSQLFNTNADTMHFEKASAFESSTYSNMSCR